jgi:hypothetical protein
MDMIGFGPAADLDFNLMTNKSVRGVRLRKETTDRVMLRTEEFNLVLRDSFEDALGRNNKGDTNRSTRGALSSAGWVLFDLTIKQDIIG